MVPPWPGEPEEDRSCVRHMFDAGNERLKKKKKDFLMKECKEQVGTEDCRGLQMDEENDSSHKEMGMFCF